jgi:hypothetical protein
MQRTQRGSVLTVIVIALTMLYCDGNFRAIVFALVAGFLVFLSVRYRWRQARIPMMLYDYLRDQERQRRAR